MNLLVTKEEIKFFKGHISIEVTIFCKTHWLHLCASNYLFVFKSSQTANKNKAIEGKTLLTNHGPYKLDTKDYFKNIIAFKSIPLQKYLEISSEWNQSYSPCHTDEGIVCSVFMTNTSLVYIHLNWLFHSVQGTLRLELYKTSNRTWYFPNTMLRVA